MQQVYSIDGKANRRLFSFLRFSNGSEAANIGIWGWTENPEIQIQHLSAPLKK